MTELRSAAIVAVPEAPPAVERCSRRRHLEAVARRAAAGHDPSSRSSPRATSTQRSSTTSARSRARFEPFAFELRELACWPDVLYLVPEPSEPFAALTQAFVAAYPDHPPYEGAHESVVPHLTVAQGDATTSAAAEADVLPSPSDPRARARARLARRAGGRRLEAVAAIPLGGRT